MLIGWALIFIATVHLAFLPSILPNILKGFRLVGDPALKSAGFIIMSYTASAMVGNLLFSRLASRMGVKKVIQIACSVASCFVVLLILSRGVFSFTLLRMIEVSSIASVIPLTFSIFARDVSGKGMRISEFGTIYRVGSRVARGNTHRGLFGSLDPVPSHRRILPGDPVGLSDFHARKRNLSRSPPPLT